MKEIAVFNDTRLLESLDYIDRDLIAEVIDDLKVPDADDIPGNSKKAVLRSLKQVLMLAACVVLISAFIPMISYVIEHYDFSLGGIFGHSTTEGTTVDTPTEHAENPSYPIFTPDLEPISDEMIAELKDVWYQKVYAAEYAASLKLYAETPFSDQQKEEDSKKLGQIKAEKYKALLFSPNREDHFRGRYYGTIADCVIFAINTYLEDEYNVITLGRTSIVNDTSIHIFAYKDGVIKTVEVAYSEGWLNDADASKIKERHDKFNAYKYWEVEEAPAYYYAKFVSDLEEISDEKIDQINNTLFRERYENKFSLWASDREYAIMYENTRRIKEEYACLAYSSAKNAGNAFIPYKEETLKSFEESFRYYGTFGNCVIWAEVGDTNDMTEYDLEFYKFSYSNGAVIKVYNNGRIYDLKEAFDKGILDIDNVRKLYHRYLTYESYLLSDRTAPILAFSEKADAAEIYDKAKAGGFVVFNDAFVTSGEDIWNEFYEKCSQGVSAAVNIVKYYPSRSAIYLTTIVYNRGQFEQYTESRSGGYSNFAYSKYKYIIKYDGEPLDSSDTSHTREEVYILVNDNTLTYPKIKESGNSINHFVAFSKRSYEDNATVSFNVTPEQDAILSDIFGSSYSPISGKWYYWFESALTAEEADIWNYTAPSDILSVLGYLSENDRFYRVWQKTPSLSSDSKRENIVMSPKQDAIITDLVDEKFKCYAGYWDIWFYKILNSKLIEDWNYSDYSTIDSVMQFMQDNLIANKLENHIPTYR